MHSGGMLAALRVTELRGRLATLLVSELTGRLLRSWMGPRLQGRGHWLARAYIADTNGSGIVTKLKPKPAVATGTNCYGLGDIDRNRKQTGRREIPFVYSILSASSSAPY